jgi:hypothetical protein
MADMGQSLVVLSHHGLGKGEQEGAVFDATGRCHLGVEQGRQVNRRATVFAARTEQIRVRAGSIKTLA